MQMVYLSNPGVGGSGKLDICNRGANISYVFEPFASWGADVAIGAWPDCYGFTRFGLFDKMDFRWALGWTYPFSFYMTGGSSVGLLRLSNRIYLNLCFGCVFWGE